MISPPITATERLERMRSNALRFKVPRLKQSSGNRKPIAICGFGPSLAETWNDIVGDVLTMSGAHDFLIGNGIIPKFHVEIDPREHKVEFLRHSHKDVTYLISSACHPAMFEVLLASKRKVLMWHGLVDESAEEQRSLLREIEKGARLIGGGTNVGMRSMIVAREMGYRCLEVHGMDCCYRGTEQWAGQHFGTPHSQVEVEVEGRVFDTSDTMLQSTDDFFNQLHMLRFCKFRIYGNGLLQARMNLFQRNRHKALNRGWWTPARKIEFLHHSHNFEVRGPDNAISKAA